MKYPKNNDFISCKTYLEVKKQLWDLFSKHLSNHDDMGEGFYFKWENKSFFGVPSLGIDWIREESRRVNGKIDIYYLNRIGARLRSLKNLTKYLLRNSGYHLNGFNFIKGVFNENKTLCGNPIQQDKQEDQLEFDNSKPSVKSKQSSKNLVVDEELETMTTTLRNDKNKIDKVRSESSLLDQNVVEENGFVSNKRKKDVNFSEENIFAAHLNNDSNKRLKKFNLLNEIHETQNKVRIIAGDQRNILDEEQYSSLVVDVSPEMILDDENGVSRDQLPEDLIRIQKILKVCGELVLLGERSALDSMIQNKPVDDSLLKIFVLGFTRNQMKFIHIRREEIRPLFVLILAHVYSHPDLFVKQESTIDLAFSCYKEMMFSSAKGKIFLNTNSLTSESISESQLCNATACELLFEMYNLHKKYYTVNFEVLFKSCEK